MSVTRETRDDARVGLPDHRTSVFVLWNGFTLAGALAGTAIGDPRTYGLDAAVGGAFLALLWPRLLDRGLPGRRTARPPPSPWAPCRSRAAGVPVLVGRRASRCSPGCSAAAGWTRPTRETRRRRRDLGGDRRGRRRLLPAQAGRPVRAAAGAGPAGRAADRRRHPGRAAVRADRGAGVLDGPRARPGRARGRAGAAVRPALLRAPFLVVVFGAALGSPVAASARRPAPWRGRGDGPGAEAHAGSEPGPAVPRGLHWCSRPAAGSVSSGGRPGSLFREAWVSVGPVS